MIDLNDREEQKRLIDAVVGAEAMAGSANYHRETHHHELISAEDDAHMLDAMKAYQAAYAYADAATAFASNVKDARRDQHARHQANAWVTVMRTYVAMREAADAFLARGTIDPKEIGQ